MITAAVDAGVHLAGVIAMLTAVVAAFLYLRIIVSMYMSVEDAGEPRGIRVPFAAGLALAVVRRRHPGRRDLPRGALRHREDATPALVLEPAPPSAVDPTVTPP